MIHLNDGLRPKRASEKRRRVFQYLTGYISCRTRVNKIRKGFNENNTPDVSAQRTIWFIENPHVLLYELCAYCVLEHMNTISMHTIMSA